MSDPHFHRDLIAWLWFAWLLFWLVSAIGIKSAVRRESPAARAAHIIPLIVGSLLIFWGDAPWSPLAVRLWSGSFAAYRIGVALVAAGLAFSVWARVHLGRNWSGTVTVKERHELICSGPYVYVRHPIYTGLIVALLGTAIADGTLAAALGVVIIAASFVRKLKTEEAFMRETFPGEYERYSATVPALIPFTRPRQSAPR